MSRHTATLQEQVVLVFEMEGVEGVCDFARVLRLPFHLCNACEAETPMIEGACACCGQGGVS